MIENHFLITVYFFGQFTTCSATFLLQKCFEMVFIKFRRSSAAWCIINVKIAIFKLCKLFSGCRFAYDTFPVYHANVLGCFSSFLVENIAFYPLDIPYVSLTNNKISKYSKRQSAHFFTVERALSNEYIRGLFSDHTTQ